jgi:hypothetical protein
MMKMTMAILKKKVEYLNRLNSGHDGTDWPMPMGTFNLDWAYGQPALYITVGPNSHGGGEMIIPRCTKGEMAKRLDVLAHGIRIGQRQHATQGEG